MTVLVGYGMGIAPSNPPSNHLFRPPFLVQGQARMELYGKDTTPASNSFNPTIIHKTLDAA